MLHLCFELRPSLGAALIMVRKYARPVCTDIFLADNDTMYIFQYVILMTHLCHRFST